MIKKIEIKTIDVYINEQFVGKIENNIEVIANLVAGASPYENYKLVDCFDLLILSTIGCFLDTVKNKSFRNQLMIELVPLQMGGEIEPVEYLK